MNTDIDGHDLVWRVLHAREDLDESEVRDLARHADEQADQITALRSRLMVAEMAIRLLCLKQQAVQR